MATVTETLLANIVNPALLELGGRDLSTLSTGSPDLTEKLAARTILALVDEVLMAAPWVCVSKRDSSLTASTTVTSDEFDYVYALPDDFLRMIGEPLYSGSLLHYSQGQYPDWRIKTRSYLECAYAGPDILYVYRTVLGLSDTDTYYTVFDSTLNVACQALCRARWAYQVTGDLNAQKAFYELYEWQIRKAQIENRKNIKRPQIERNRLRYVRWDGNG